jgi:hypothetical protein
MVAKGGKLPDPEIMTPSHQLSSYSQHIAIQLATQTPGRSLNGQLRRNQCCGSLQEGKIL